MRILHTVESYYPQKNGMSEVVRQISEGLVKLGHEVFVATTKCNNRVLKNYNGVQIIEFDISGNFVNGIYGEIDNYIKLITSNEFDILTNFAAQQWATDLCFEYLPKIKSKKVLVPTGFSGLFNKAYSSYFKKLQNKLANYDQLVFTSSEYRDYKFVYDNGFRNNIIIPNGASKKEFSEQVQFNIREKLKLNPGIKIILHVGSYTEKKGHLEALKIFSKIKNESTVMVFVGENFNNDIGIKFSSKLNWPLYFNFKRMLRPWYCMNLLTYLKLLLTGLNKKIFMISLDRKELINTYKQADIFLFPSNIECSPVVMFEAMASKTPFLISNVGNANEIVNFSNAGYILPSKIDLNGFTKININKSVKLLNRLLNDIGLIDRLGKNGENLWLQNYTWEHITLKYENLYFKLLAKK